MSFASSGPIFNPRQLFFDALKAENTHILFHRNSTGDFKDVVLSSATTEVNDIVTPFDVSSLPFPPHISSKFLQDVVTVSLTEKRKCNVA